MTPPSCVFTPDPADFCSDMLGDILRLLTATYTTQPSRNGIGIHESGERIQSVQYVTPPQQSNQIALVLLSLQSQAPA